ncbi:hypothetical protein NDI39_27480 [Microcoleus sp. ZQ-A2]|nr:hypothetical protein [Microcoleus sp. FACHB-1]
MPPEAAFFKSEAARILKVHANTITAWDTIAFFRIPHYRKCYEVLPGKFNRRQPLCRYQLWVLGRIKKLIKRLKSAERVRSYLSAYPQEFTFQAFQQEK